jgi:hypothetical protein
VGRRLIAVWALIAAACIEPTFPVDKTGDGAAAGMSDAESELPMDPGASAADAAHHASVDAGSDAALETAVKTLPEWAKPLLGRYFKRSISMGFDDFVKQPIVTIETSLVTSLCDR